MTFWSTQTLKIRIPAEGIIAPYDPHRVTHAAYERAVGDEAFVTSNPSDRTQLAPGLKIVIPPGQFGLLTTQESLRVPPDAIALISIRASIKFKGLVNVSGFHADPGYAGPLKFAVYNAGSQPIVLDQGERAFMIWFTSLDEADDDPYKPKSAGTVVISASDVAKIQGDVASPAALKKQIDELRSEVDKRLHTIQADIDKRWHATEQLGLNKKWVMGVLITLASAILIMLLRSYVEKPAAPASAAKTQLKVPAPPATQGQVAAPIFADSAKK